ncbi:MAG: ferrous iron transport protein B [Bacteroidales bacterium]|nr:ferrous iron transport protein B [Bacteroidales bacterium]MBR6875715.1 ferrous iron transport protein B [Bacteroidales bacterium]
MTLKELPIGGSAVILTVGGKGSLRQHFLDMGLIPGARVKLVKYAPLGDPMELRINGYALTLRLADAAMIQIEPVAVEEEAVPAAERPVHDADHPGLGEGGKYHDKKQENALPDGTRLTFALAGNQNCGKTTLFNQLTGSNQHVGNFPGVTVDRKDGVIRGHAETCVTDLPGIYSLSPYTSEEIVSRNFILNEKPRGIINIVDAGNIERNLYLTMQLMELDTPMVLALNMMDEVRSNGGSIRVNEMEEALGIPVVPISAARNEGIDELVEHAVHVARYQERPARQDFCDKNDHGGAVHRCLHGVMQLIEDHAERAGIPLRFAASRLVEGDAAIEQALALEPNEKEMVEHIILQMEEERGLDRNAAMADMRFAFIRRLTAQTVVKPRESKEYRRSRRIDRVMTGRWTAIPIFLVIMCCVIWLSIDVLGAPLQDLLDQAIQGLAGVVGTGLDRWGVAPAVRSLVVDGVFGGVGTVVSFVPIIVILFFFLSMLEDSGYMARVAFVTDKMLRRLGLSGRSIVPLLIGFGCSVPAVMSTRTLSSSRDRRMTILLTPFISCSAKIPIYAFFTDAFFPGHGGLVLVVLYLSAILIGIVVALVGKLLPQKDGAAPFVMELPNYRWPGAKNVGHLLWDKTKDFLQRAFTVIFVASIVIWILQSFDFRLQLVEPGESMLAAIAGLLAPLFQPLGLGDWRVVTALVTGFLAKESVVATLEVLNVTASLTALTAIPMLAFCLLYTPCVAAIAAVKRELGGKWAVWMIVFQCAVAWVVAWLAYLAAGLFF